MSDQTPPDYEFLKCYFECGENFLGVVLDSSERMRNHFNDDGMLKGNGQWRLREIFESCRSIEEAEERFLIEHDQLLRDFSIPIDKAAGTGGQ